MGFEESLVENHEESAKFAFWTCIILGILSAIAFIASYKSHDLSGVITLVVLLFSFATMYYLWQTSETGGKIRHSEIIESPVIIESSE